MSAPRFSVVIPTRERAETLSHALRTCLEQNFADYEVVVCDNASSPATRQVVEQARSRRVRYVRSGEPLSMSANWELAVSHARGRYVTVLGDDDGLLPCALNELDRLVRRHGEPGAVHWYPALYTWPSIAVAEDANFLRLPTDRCERVLVGRTQLQRAASWEIGPHELPMIYRSVIRHDLIERHRQQVGRVFPTLYPDVYSGYAFAHLAGSYVSVQVPLSIAGLSGRSNGVATLLRTDDNPIAEEFNRLQRAFGYRRHPTVPDVELVPVNADDSFQYARDLFFPGDVELALDRRRAAERYLAAIPHVEPTVRAEVRARIRTSLADRPDLLDWFDGLPDPGPCPPYRCRPGPFGYDGWGLTLDSTRFGVSDVSGAVRLTTDLLGLSGQEIHYNVPTRQQTDEAWSAALAASKERVRMLEAVSNHGVSEALNKIESLRQELAEVVHERDALRHQLTGVLADSSLRRVPQRVFRKVIALLGR
jgi:glycosyltransferase involved in cell wall biosynthesis